MDQLRMIVHYICRYALTGAEVKAILMQRHVKVDGKVRTNTTYPAGYMDVIDIDKTDEHFRLVYDAKGRFVTHRITKVGPIRIVALNDCLSILQKKCFTLEGRSWLHNTSKAVYLKTVSPRDVHHSLQTPGQLCLHNDYFVCVRFWPCCMASTLYFPLDKLTNWIRGLSDTKYHCHCVGGGLLQALQGEEGHLRQRRSAIHCCPWWKDYPVPRPRHQGGSSLLLFLPCFHQIQLWPSAHISSSWGIQSGFT